MIDRENVIKGLKCIIEGTVRCESCGYAVDKHGHYSCKQNCASDALALLKEWENLKQKMWNALYAEEDNLEEKFTGTEKHRDWFFVYRPWLQRGFEIAIKVIAEQDRM